MKSQFLNQLHAIWAGRVFPVWIACFCLNMKLPAEPVEPRPGYAMGMPYPDRMYENDRRGTGYYFKDIRTLRSEKGIEAGIAALAPALADYRDFVPDSWSATQEFDEWGFWVWHEAQFDSGKNDPEWAAALYRWLHEEARRIKRMDWVFHTSGSVLAATSDMSRWTDYRALLGEMTTYLQSQGFPIDPLRLPDRGLWDEEVPGVRMREFPVKIPNGKHVVYWQRPEQKDPSKPAWMDKGTANHLLHVGQEHFNQGEWRQSIELGLWVISFVESLDEHNQGKKERERILREEQQLYLDAVRGVTGTLRVLGLREAEERLIDRALNRKLDARMDGEAARNRLRTRLLELRILKGEASDEILKELDSWITTKDRGHDQNEIAALVPRLVKGKCLMAMGRKAEALALMEELRALGARKFGSWLEVELTHLDWCMDRGELSVVGKLLPELLENVRKEGLKITEIALYERYVRWAELAGDPALAVWSQRELLRLLEGFSMAPRLPAAKATLARLLALMGAQEESAALAAKALTSSEMANLPGRVREEVRRIVAGIPTNPQAASRTGRILLQPGKALSMAAAGFPSRLMLQVVNVGKGRSTGILRITGAECSLSWDKESCIGTLTCGGSPGSNEVQVDVEAQSMALFHCVTPAVPESGLMLNAEWLEDGKVMESAEWKIQAADSSSSQAIIDAGIYRTDGYCMIPIYHHLQSQDRKIANLRARSSIPCRIELYDESGRLMMVDATGNGSCSDGGDWLREDSDGNGAVELKPHAATGETNFHIFADPQGDFPSEGIVLKIEWLIEGKWHLAAEDRITVSE